LTGSSKGLVTVPNIEQNFVPNNSQNDTKNSSLFRSAV
jgi:hypothetical protein